GMAQRGVAQLIASRVIERSVRAGRGHDYRFSGWALGRDARTHPGPPEAASAPSDAAAVEHMAARGPAADTVRPARPPVATPPPVHAEPGGESTMVVEIGGLVVRLPVGT